MKYDPLPLLRRFQLDAADKALLDSYPAPSATTFAEAAI